MTKEKEEAEAALKAEQDAAKAALEALKEVPEDTPLLEELNKVTDMQKEVDSAINTVESLLNQIPEEEEEEADSGSEAARRRKRAISGCNALLEEMGKVKAKMDAMAAAGEFAPAEVEAVKGMAMEISAAKTTGKGRREQRLSHAT